MPYFAKIGADDKVLNVVIEDSMQACLEHNDGIWVETRDNHPTEKMAGKGDIYNPADPRKFIRE